MCGRFTLQTPADMIAQMFLELSGSARNPLEIPEYPFRYNIAPTQSSLCVLSPSVHEYRARDLRWGLVPSWSKDIKFGARTINARSESVADKPSFRSAFKKRRCLVLADGFFEWTTESGRKQPYYISLKSKQPFCLAGLWETWHDRTNSDSVAVETFTIITTGANSLMEPLHDRMPVILPKETWEVWLDPEFRDPGALQEMMVGYPSESMQAVAVNPVVNKVANDGPQCIEPVNVQKRLI